MSSGVILPWPSCASKRAMISSFAQSGTGEIAATVVLALMILIGVVLISSASDATFTDKVGFAAGSSSEPRGRTNCVRLAIVVASGVCPCGFAAAPLAHVSTSRHRVALSSAAVKICRSFQRIPGGEPKPAPNHVAPPRPARGSNGANQVDRKPEWNQLATSGPNGTS
jgi:hypothetical protein